MPIPMLVAISGAVGVILCDRGLTRAAVRRRDAIRMGLPAVADLLALAVAAGESPVAAGRAAREEKGTPGAAERAAWARELQVRGRGRARGEAQRG